MAKISKTSYPDGVYPPSDDTFLLVDALAYDVAGALSGKKSKMVSNILPLDADKVCTVTEMGCGSGFVAASAALLLPLAYVLGTDLSSRACLASKKTFESHDCSPRSDVVASESLCSFKSSLSFDIILANPPYVPTSTEELSESLAILRAGRQKPVLDSAGDRETESAAFTLTWAGGEDGIEMTKKMLRAALGHLSLDRGRLYLVVVAENHPDVLKAYATELWDEIWAEKYQKLFEEEGGRKPKPTLSAAIAVQTRANNELLSVLRFCLS
jgi:release factor glutamine methyltransferase